MKTSVKLVREGNFAAEVSVNLIEEPGGWSPYLSIEDGQKLDAVRKSLKDGNLAAAARYGRVFELTPVSV
jgi:hypothetical protein